MMKRRLIVSMAVLFLPLMAWAQREDLRVYCRAMNADFNGKRPLHIRYDLTVTGNAQSPGKEVMAVEAFRSSGRSKIVMGNVQEVLQSGHLVLSINHLNKMMEVNTGSPDADPLYSLMEDLSVLVDSATHVLVKKEQKRVTYTCYYSRHFIYSEVRFSFDPSTKRPLALVGEFNSRYPEPFYSMEIEYKQWDHNWQPEQNFPGIEKYIARKGERYEAQGSWKGYSFYQPEKGVLKF